MSTPTHTPSDDVIKATPPHHAKSIGTSPKPTGAPMKKAAKPFAVADSLTARSKKHMQLAERVEKLAVALATAEKNLAAAARTENGDWRAAFTSKARGTLIAAAEKQHTKEFKPLRAKAKRALDIHRARLERIERSLEEERRLFRERVAQNELEEADREVELGRRRREEEAKLPALRKAEADRLHDKTQATANAARSARDAFDIAKDKLGKLRDSEAKRRKEQLVRAAVTAATLAASDLNVILDKIINPAKRDPTVTPRSLATAGDGHIATINKQLTREVIVAMDESPTKATSGLAGKIKMAECLHDDDRVPVGAGQGAPSRAIAYYITRWAEQSAPRATATAPATKAADPAPQKYLTPSVVGDTDSEPEDNDNTMSVNQPVQESEDATDSANDAMSGDEGESESEDEDDDAMSDSDDEDDSKSVFSSAGDLGTDDMGPFGWITGPCETYPQRMWCLQQPCRCPTRATSYCEECRRYICGTGCLVCEEPAEGGCGHSCSDRIPE